MTASHFTDAEAELAVFGRQYWQFHKRLSRLDSDLAWHSSHQTIFRHRGMRLIRFNGNASGAPLLIVYSHVNRPEILDLGEDHSMVRRLIECGHRVYLLDWGEVRQSDAKNPISMYFHDYLDKAVDAVTRDSDHDSVNLLGVCQGGTFSLCYAALMPQKIKALAVLVTPVDFHLGESLLTKWCQHMDFTTIAKQPKNIPGKMLVTLFQSMRPFLDMKRNVALIKQFSEGHSSLELTALIDRWIVDCPDQPGRAFAEFMMLFFQQNALVCGDITIDKDGSNEACILANIQTPVLNVYALDDHLVPPASSRALAYHIDDDRYTEMTFAGGHIGLLISKRAQRDLIPRIGKWFTLPDKVDNKS